MPDDAEQIADENMDNAIDEMSKEFDEGNDDSEDTSSDDSDSDSNADSATDSEDSKEDSDDEDKKDEDSKEDSEEKSDEDEEDPDFTVRDMPTSIKNLVANLERKTPEERQEKIDSLDPVRNKAELEAIRKQFPDSFDKPEKFEVSQEKWDAMQAQLDKFKNLDKAEETMKLYDALEKKQPELEAELTTRILKEKYGDRFEEVDGDPKFQASMKALGKLDLADRIAQASMHSKAAREILINTAASKQNSLKALAKKKAGGEAQKGAKNDITTDEGFDKEFGEAIDKMEY